MLSSNMVQKIYLVYNYRKKFLNFLKQNKKIVMIIMSH
jgi:hypothetical protein